ncbi:unnamed protein product [Rhodiola kirilowii]
MTIQEWMKRALPNVEDLKVDIKAEAERAEETTGPVKLKKAPFISDIQIVSGYVG